MHSNSRIAIIDYGVGNHQSVANALAFLGYRFVITHQRSEIEAASALVLPGVGAFGEAMDRIRGLGIAPLLTEQVHQRRKPLLGICLGMQLLADTSAENGCHQGLGLIPAQVVPIPPQHGMKVPQVGWNTVQVHRRDVLFSKTTDTSAFYFDHSLHLVCAAEFVAATVSYGGDLVAAVQRDNVLGVQFHPEKSHNSGLKLFRSFFSHHGISR